jgi:hypothetical protein
MLDSLAKEYRISEDEIVKAIEKEAAGKQFTLDRKDNRLTLSWVEDGIREWRHDLTQEYSEETEQVYGGKVGWTKQYYQKFRMIDRIIYLDGRERVLKTLAPENPTKVSKETFDKVLEQIKRANAKQEAEGTPGV